MYYMQEKISPFEAIFVEHADGKQASQGDGCDEAGNKTVSVLYTFVSAQPAECRKKIVRIRTANSEMKATRMT